MKKFFSLLCFITSTYSVAYSQDTTAVKYSVTIAKKHPEWFKTFHAFHLLRMFVKDIPSLDAPTKNFILHFKSTLFTDDDSTAEPQFISLTRPESLDSTLMITIGTPPKESVDQVHAYGDNAIAIARLSVQKNHSSVLAGEILHALLHARRFRIPAVQLADSTQSSEEERLIGLEITISMVQMELFTIMFKEEVPGIDQEVLDQYSRKHEMYLKFANTLGKK